MTWLRRLLRRIRHTALGPTIGPDWPDWCEPGGCVGPVVVVGGTGERPATGRRR